MMPLNHDRRQEEDRGLDCHSAGEDGDLLLDFELVLLALYPSKYCLLSIILLNILSVLNLLVSFRDLSLEKVLGWISDVCCGQRNVSR